MLRALKGRFQQKYRTIEFPRKSPILPEKFRGLPILTCDSGTACTTCMDICPVNALERNGEGGLELDLGDCIFCGKCEGQCKDRAISFSKEYRLSTSTRDGLIVRSGAERELKVKLSEQIAKTFGRSLKLRQVSAGGCNACELDLNVLNTVVFDIGRFGIQFVASPRHADGLVVTGPVTRNMKLALQKTYDAVASPKIVICVGSCAISGGPFAGHPEVNNGVGDLLKVDLFVPGCPPHPIVILDGLLRMMGRL